MTEKRFIRIKNENGISIKDTKTGYERYYAIEVLDHLNELAEENKQLKKMTPSIYNKNKGDWKWNVNNDTILNIRTGEIFHLRNSGAVENLVDLLNGFAEDVEKWKDKYFELYFKYENPPKRPITEKRFSIKHQDDYFGVVDNITADKVCVVNGIHTKIEAEWLCDLLNSLNEENEQLRIRNELLTDENEQYKALVQNKWGEYLRKRMREVEE